MYILEQKFSDGYTNIFIFNSFKECDEFFNIDKSRKVPNSTTTIIENSNDKLRWLSEYKPELFKKKKLLSSRIDVGDINNSYSGYLVITPNKTKVGEFSYTYNYSKIMASYEEAWEYLTNTIGEDIYDLDQQKNEEFTDLIDNRSIEIEYAAFKNNVDFYCILRCF